MNLELTSSRSEYAAQVDLNVYGAIATVDVIFMNMLSIRGSSGSPIRCLVMGGRMLHSPPPPFPPIQRMTSCMALFPRDIHSRSHHC